MSNPPSSSLEPASGQRGKGAYLLLSLAVLVLDQWSKQLIEAHLPHHASHEVIPGLLSITHVRNTGVAFGLFASRGGEAHTWLLSGLGALALAVVGIYFWRTGVRHRMLLTALALVLGGAVGNLQDRLAAGAVTDFIDFYVGTYHWHTFNVADSAITVGLCLLVADALWPVGGRQPEGPAEGPATT
jgi:signal peptidase II